MGDLDNQDALESFDFDTFLNNDKDETGFGFDPNMPSELDMNSLAMQAKQKCDVKESSAMDDTSPGNPDVWILRWTTLEKTELRQ